MEYALHKRSPVLGQEDREQLILAIRRGDRSVLDGDARVIHICDAVRKKDYYCIACDGRVRRRTEPPKGSTLEQFYHLPGEDPTCVDRTGWPHSLKTARCCQPTG